MWNAYPKLSSSGILDMKEKQYFNYDTVSRLTEQNLLKLGVIQSDFLKKME